MNQSTLHTDVLIIGVGLTGLTLAYLLRDTNLRFKVIEARPRLGGRIYTLEKDDTATIEMGATWLGKKHSALLELLSELGIGIFEQVLGDKAIYEPISTSPPQLVQLPPNNEPSYRIVNGTYSLIDAVAQHIDSNNISLNEVVHSISEDVDQMRIVTDKGIYSSYYVVSTLPPYLLSQSIALPETLSKDLLSIMSDTHTWMGESIKVSLSYKTPWWNEENFSGTIFSSVGPIPEMYDHTSHQGNKFALKGFLNGAYFSVTKDERLKLILSQLQKYFGEKANDYISYDEMIWRKEPYTFIDYNSHVLPHQNNGHALYQNVYCDNRFYIAGAETSVYYPGYMDGAVRSATKVAESIKSKITL